MNIVRSKTACQSHINMSVAPMQTVLTAVRKFTDGLLKGVYDTALGQSPNLFSQTSDGCITTAHWQATAVGGINVVIRDNGDGSTTCIPFAEATPVTKPILLGWLKAALAARASR
jgi:hypothetical protein